MSRKSKQSTRAVIRYIITFVLMVSLVGISLMSYGKYSMLSVHGVINSCERVKYFKDICNEMETEAYTHRTASMDRHTERHTERNRKK